MSKRFINGLPNSVREGRVLMHNHVSHGPNWPTGSNGFRAWTDDNRRWDLSLALVDGQGFRTTLVKIMPRLIAAVPSYISAE
jgi:hypothetical protein